MATVYSFTADNKAVLNNSTARVIIQLQKEDITSGYSNLDWTSNIVHGELFPFSNTEIFEGGDIIPGEIQTTSYNLEAINKIFDSSLGTRLSDVFKYDPYVEAIHIRVGYTRNPSTEANTWHSGILNYSSINWRYEKLNDTDTWFVSLDVQDPITIMEDVTTKDWVDNILTPDSYSYSAENIYLSYLASCSDTQFGNYGVGQGRVKLGGLYQKNSNGDYHPDKNNPILISPVGIRFYKIEDIFQSVHDYLGLEGTMLFGGSISYMWNNEDYTGSDSLILFEGNTDDLYVMSPHYDTAATNDYQADHTLFDPKVSQKASLFNYNSVLEAIKFLSVSLGLSISVKTTIGGDRYLNVEGAGYSSTTLTGVLDSYSASVNHNIEFIPWPEKFDGLKVNTEYASKYAIGSLSNNKIEMDCLFVHGQNIIRQYVDNIYNPPIAGNGPHDVVGWGSRYTGTTPHTVYGDMGDMELFMSLWISTDTPTGAAGPNGNAKKLSQINTVCFEVPYRNGSPMPSSALGPLPYPGEYYTTIGTKTINGIGFPKITDPYHENWHGWETPHITAIANFYYTNKNFDDNTLSLNRKYQRTLEITIPDMLHIDIGQEVILHVGGNPVWFRVVGKSVDLSNFTTTFKLLLLEYIV